MSVDEAIEAYDAFAEKIFSAKRIGRHGKFDAKIFEDTVKGIVTKVTQNAHERMMDDRSNACKVYVAAVYHLSFKVSFLPFTGSSVPC